MIPSQMEDFDMAKKMFRKFIYILLLLVCLTACSLPGNSGNLPTVISQVVESGPPTLTPTVRQNLVANPTTAQGNADSFTLTSPEVTEAGELPVEYTCDGVSSTLPLAWSGAPAGTVNYALIMHHIASPTDIHWYWVLYDIPASVASLNKNVTGIGVLGTNVNNNQLAYSPPVPKDRDPRSIPTPFMPSPLSRYSPSRLPR